MPKTERLVYGLNEARRLLTEGGWFRGQSTGYMETINRPRPGKRDEDCQCLVTAIDWVMMTGAEEQLALGYVLEALGNPPIINTPRETIIRLNDDQDPDEGYQWAVDILTKAIDIAQAHG